MKLVEIFSLEWHEKQKQEIELQMSKLNEKLEYTNRQIRLKQNKKNFGVENFNFMQGVALYLRRNKVYDESLSHIQIMDKLCWKSWLSYKEFGLKPKDAVEEDLKNN